MMDAFEMNKLWNLWYHQTYHRYCEHTNRWIIRNEDRCLYCDPANPKCFIVGGKRNG